MNQRACQSQLGALDPLQPWFAPYGDTLEQLRQRVGQRADAAAALSAVGNARDADGSPRFVSSREISAAEAYETFIARTGTVPTRDNLHDLFNGLIWLRYPQAKRRLNELQAAEIGRQGAGAARGPVRDAITVFDENGALLDAPDAVWDALLARDWRQLFVGLRPLWAQARLRVFGHALLEKLLVPRKEITAHVWARQCPLQATAEADGWLAGQFSKESLAGKPFTPLPLLGIPGWWPENHNFSFYDDALVFRQPAGKT